MKKSSALSKILVGLAGLGIVGGGVWWGYTQFEERQGEGTPEIGGTFSLKDPRGNPVESWQFANKILLLYFGYTFCPDVCPTALANIQKVLKLLGDAAFYVRPFFITIDPGRDTPALVAEYMKQYDFRILPLLGSESQIQKLMKKYKVYAARSADTQDPKDPHYLIDHTSIIYVINSEGKYLGHFSYDTDPREIARQLLPMIQTLHLERKSRSRIL